MTDIGSIKYSNCKTRYNKYIFTSKDLKKVSAERNVELYVRCLEKSYECSLHLKSINKCWKISVAIDV